MKKRALAVIAGFMFSVTFGIIDNGFLVAGMELNPFVDPHMDPILSGMWGNTFSDFVGAVLGTVVSWSFLKIFKVEPKEYLLSEVIGITLGCLVPIALYTLVQH
jgi:tetrahydromethanopterin S-methyltransferase subunit E